MMIVDAAEFYNSVRSKCDLPCEHSIRIQRVITYPFQRNDEIIGGDAGMLCPVIENSAVSRENDILFDFKIVFMSSPPFVDVASFIDPIIYPLYICQAFFSIINPVSIKPTGASYIIHLCRSNDTVTQNRSFVCAGLCRPCVRFAETRTSLLSVPD